MSKEIECILQRDDGVKMSNFFVRPFRQPKVFTSVASVIRAAAFFGVCVGTLSEFVLYGCPDAEAGFVPDQNTLTLSIQDAVSSALKHNPAIQSDQEKLDEIKQTINYAWAQVLPNIAGTGTATKQKDSTATGGGAFQGTPYNSYSLVAKLTQPLYTGGAASAAIEANHREQEVREKTLEIDSRDLTVQVMEAFYTTLTDQKVLQILKDTRSVLEQTVATNQNYYKIGRAQLLDVLQAKTTLALLLPQISTAENNMKSAASQLLQLLHENQAKTMNLLGPVSYVDPDQVHEFIAKKTILPEITRGEKQLAEFQKQQDVTLAAYNPTANLLATYGKSAYTQSNILNDYSNNWTISLQVSIPIFNGLASIYQRRVLASQEKELEFGQMSLLDQLSYNQTQAERNLQVAAVVLKSSKEADDLGKASLKEAQRDFKLQTINYLQLLTSQQNYLSAESSYAQAEYSYIDSVAKYFVATGIPITDLISILNK